MTLRTCFRITPTGFITSSLALIAALCLAVPTSAQTNPDDENWQSRFGEPGMTFGARHGVVANGLIYMTLGTATYPDGVFAIWDGSGWRLEGEGIFNQGLADIAVIGTDIYIAGSFTTISGGGEGIAYVARWDGAAWHALGEGVNGPVVDLAVDGNGMLYAGGQFLEAGGEPSRRIARWDGTSWSPLGDATGLENGVGGQVSAIAIAGDRVYVGGAFTEAGGQDATSIAVWNAVTSEWSPVGGGVRREGFPTAGVVDIGVHGDDIYVGGDMEWAINGDTEIPVGQVAVFRGGAWEALGSGSSVFAALSALHVTPDGGVFACGDFSDPPTFRTEGVAEWTGSTWVPLDLDAYDWRVDEIVSYNGEIVALGAQDSAGNTSIRTNGIARWTGSEWRGLGLGIAGPESTTPGSVAAIAEYDGALYAGGEFFAAGDTEVRSFARLDADDWSVVGGGIEGIVKALASTSDGLVVGGGLFEAGGMPVTQIARWDGSAWSAMGDGLGMFGFADVNKLDVMDGELYAGGSFFRSGSATVRGIARWTGSAWEAVGGGAQFVETFAARGNQIVVGAITPTLSVDYGPDGNGVPTELENVAVWDGATWSGVGGGVNGGVRALAFDGPDIIVGGEFTEAGGVPANNLARWDGSTWTAFGDGLNGVVRAVHANGSDIYVGGDFTEAGGIEANGVARWDGAAWQALGSGVLNVRLVNPPPLSVRAFAGTTDGLYVGGMFTRAGTRPANNIDLWTDYSPVGVAIDDGPGTPGRPVELGSTYPNPFSERTTLQFELNQSADVTITIFDLLGRRITTVLPQTRMGAGSHEVPFEGSALSPGVYFFRLVADGVAESGRLLVVR